MLRSLWIETAVALACTAAAVTGVRAATLEYRLELPADSALSYALEFEVARPGVVTLSAEWSSARVLVMRLEREGLPAQRRTGTSPLRLEIPVSETDLSPDSPWTVTLSGLPSRRIGTARLVVELPEQTAAAPAAPAPLAPAPVEPDATWRREAARPSELGPKLARLYDATERLRLRVVGAADPDGYRWQDPLLRFLAARRDQAPRAGSGLAPATRTLLRRIVEVIRELDELRRSQAEPVRETVPQSGIERRVWDRLRDPRFAPLDDELDALLDELQAGHVRELDREPWVSRLVSCLIVCGRHFEERALVEDEEESRAEVVRQQWPRVLVAAEALTALCELP